MSEVRSFLRTQLADALAEQTDRHILGMPVRTSRWLPPGTAIILSGETIMAPRTTSPKTIRVNVYDGPHHGRILDIPETSQRTFVLPNPMPAGLMHAKGRSNPSEFSHLREVTYELRTPQAGGSPYLAYVEIPRASFIIPPVPVPQPVKVSARAKNLIDRLMDRGYNYRVGSAADSDSRRQQLVEARVNIAEYISELERANYGSPSQGSRVSRTELY